MVKRFTRKPILSCLLAWSALAATALCGPSFNVTDLKSRSITIELVALTGDTVKFRRPGNPKDFTLPINQFDEASQKEIRTQAATLPAEKPKITMDVILGKRRKDQADSYYMETQEITASVKLINGNPMVGVPKVTGKIVFIGQNTRSKDFYIVLSSQDFEATLKPGETLSKELQAFATTYDSDNKGYGNVGGHKYFGWVVALMDEGGNVIQSQTSSGSIRQAIDSKGTLLGKILEYRKNTQLNDKMEPGSPPP